MKSKLNGKFRLKWGGRVSVAAGVVAAAVLPLLGWSKAGAQNIQPIYSFPQGPATPYAPLVEGVDGNLYGTTWSGGSGGEGTVFKITANGVLTVLYSFSPPTSSAGDFFTNPDGGKPEAGLAPGSDGNFYGTTWEGGTNGDGTVFEITTDGVLNTLVAFAGTNGANPETGLTPGPDGNFYGTTDGGGSNHNGTVFRVTTNGVLTVLHSFSALNDDGVTGNQTNSDGAGPYAGLTLGANGDFYGATSAGGSGGSGTLFEVTTNGALTNLYTFSAENYNDSGIGEAETNSDGAFPTATLIPGLDGNFYGTTRAGGKGGGGTVFEVTPGGALTTLYTFSAPRFIYIGNKFVYTNSDGALPYGSLMLTNGDIYGTASGGGSSGVGTLFEITSGGAFTNLLTFTNANGANPGGALVPGPNGYLYGTTGEGGTSGNGSVFEVTLTGVFTTLYSFANDNGAEPYAGLTLGPNGRFYGTTYTGGSYGAGVQVNADGYGTVFEVTTNGALTTLINFANTNGQTPEAGLTPGPNGNFYGTTYSGGSNGFGGTMFETTTNGVLTTLATFAGGTNAQNPAAGLIPGANGNFYGTTIYGGADDSGTVFEVTTNGVITNLYSFTGGNDGSFPYGSLTLGTNGNFYGTCAYGGNDGYGTVFEVTPNGGFTVLHSFTDGSDGADPFAGLTQGQNGDFYGTTYGDGASTYGTVFEMTPDGVLTNLYTFTGGDDSASPSTALTLGPDGNFYGTTYGGTADEGIGNDNGTVFEVTPNGAFTTLAGFANTNGAASRGNLVLGPDGNFYGTTSYGGAEGIGEIYRLDLPPEITRQPAGQSTNTGAQVTLSVALFGTSPYSFQWLSNNIPIVAATNSTLTIPDFAAGDAAGYSVMVSNAWGSVTSAVASLTVGGGPLISGISLSANGNVILDCQSQANIASRLWATTNLAIQTDWTPIGTNSVTSPTGAWQFTDTNGLYQQRYYRLSTP
jgi:uncharacterized repeat protein (TIGR03803 family)